MVSLEYKARLRKESLSEAVGYSKETTEGLLAKVADILERVLSDDNADPSLTEVFHEIINMVRAELFDEVEEAEISSYELFIASLFYTTGKTLQQRQDKAASLLTELLTR